MAEPDLNALLQRSGRGDQRAFRELYDAAAPKIMAIAVRLLNDRHQAEDVVQQTMISAWRSGSDYDPERSQATTWLASIARYRALDLLRKSARQHAILREGQHDILQVLGHDQSLHKSDPIPSETVSRLEHCLGEITRDQAGCIQLAFVDGLTFSEIATQLDRSIGTVKSWVRRGLQKLRECVER
ncbi:MAG: RNA polymerase sigma factor [Woeseiaceae bacterium]